MAMASAKGDMSVVNSYIRDLPAIQRMKQIANGGM
jgi:division protein CdvB (Snf7/Vps24/ESCRT-III family)